MLKALVTLEDNGDLFKIFFLEDKDFGSDRASYDVTFEDNILKINVLAKDSVALRSVLNTITKIITVYEKTSDVLGEENE
jgi:tRNA threonylcarbamoyladenosine modification (KEOPS) complex  Pcc1 subunit